MRFELRRVRLHRRRRSVLVFYLLPHFRTSGLRHVRKTELIFASDLMGEHEILARKWKIHIMSKVCNVCDTFVHPAAFNP